MIVTQAAFYQTAATIYKFFVAKGLTPDQACGIVAQADAESSENPKAVGDKDHAFGLFQLHVDRITLIKAGTGIDIHALPSVEDQCAGVWYELNHSEKRALTQIKAQKTAYDAGFVACRFYERPGSIAQWAKRGGAAQKWAEYFAAHPVA